jgi:DNA-binding transcriptional LysR family regulator
MELHQLAYFESVSRHLHFTRAAEELNVAQPSVSQQIRKLEAELGTPLFHRMKPRVALTEAGQTFLPYARAVLQQLEEARIEVQELSGLAKGTLAVGAPPSVGTHLLPRALAAFSRRRPGIRLTFREGGSRTLVQLVEDGELDLAVVIQPIRHPALETLPLLEEELLLAVPRGHPLATTRRRLRLAELKHEPFVLLREGAYDLRDQTLSACRRAGFEPRVALDGGEMDSVLRFVAAGIGLAILPAMVLDDLDPHTGPRALRIHQPRLSRSLVLARRRDRYFSAAAREFAGVLQAIAQASPTAPPAQAPSTAAGTQVAPAPRTAPATQASRAAPYHHA